MTGEVYIIDGNSLDEYVFYTLSYTLVNLKSYMTGFIP